MSAPSTESGSNTRSLRQSLGHSAEYAIALALLLVGVVVGAVVWFSNQAERVGVVTEIAMASDDAETEAATRAHLSNSESGGVEGRLRSGACEGCGLATGGA